MNNPETTPVAEPTAIEPPDLEQIMRWLAPLWTGLGALVIAGELRKAIQGKPVSPEFSDLVNNLLPQLLADWEAEDYPRSWG